MATEQHCSPRVLYLLCMVGPTSSALLGRPPRLKLGKSLETVPLHTLLPLPTEAFGPLASESLIDLGFLCPPLNTTFLPATSTPPTTTFVNFQV